MLLGMFCSWKKNSSAPCSCAYELRASVPDVLNHLSHLGQGTMVLRQQGLSLAKITPFGPVAPVQSDDLTRLWDKISGLETDACQLRSIYLMTDASDRRPLLAMGEAGKAIDLSIRLDGYTWESSAVTALLKIFNGTPLDCRDSRRLGAGAWLDDWEDVTLPSSDGELIRVASHAVKECEWLEVEIKAGGHRNLVRFAPSFIDSEGGVLRVADRFCKHVVYADVEAPDFRLERISGKETRIFRETAASQNGKVFSHHAA